MLAEQLKSAKNGAFAVLSYVLTMCTHAYSMVYMTTLHIRIDEDIKEKARAVFASVGLDMSTAVKMFLSQSVIENGIPFTATNNEKRIREKWDAEVREAIAQGRVYSASNPLQGL